MKINMTVKGLVYESSEVKGSLEELNFNIECSAEETMEAVKMMKETIIARLNTKKEEK